LGDGDEYDPDTLRAKAAAGSDRIPWPELLAMKRVVILAEAGTGKTHELRETTHRLRRQKKAAAFFCRIEELADRSLEEALEEGSDTEFRSWEEKAAQDTVRIVQLAPLTIDQMRRFAAGQKVRDVASFMDALERADAKIFAERPQDLLDLVAYWNEHGMIGSHAEMLAFNMGLLALSPSCHAGHDLTNAWSPIIVCSVERETCAAWVGRPGSVR
jgi:hypothetical protein